MHEKRWRVRGDFGSPGLERAENGSRQVTLDGYVRQTVNGRRLPEHRRVMEQMQGRPLERWENVHHKNGVRSDNRPENLEIWVTAQPAGQRVEDLVAWARWILEQYE